MIHILKYLRTELKKITPRVFNKNASKQAIFPYVVFRFPTTNQLETDREDIILEIDIWDYAKDGYDAVVNVELLTSSIDRFLEKNRHLDGDMLLIFEKMNRLSLPDLDENVERRQLRYTIKYYDRNKN